MTDRVRPVLFLDIDGVLNYSGCAGDDPLDRGCVEQLNRVIDVSGCVVVVSSTWRIYYPLYRIELMLKTSGFRHGLLGATPDFFDRDRGDEIAAWLKRFPYFGPIAIVDDDSDMGRLSGRLVKTDFHGGGLKATHAERLIALLMEGAG